MNETSNTLASVDNSKVPAGEGITLIAPKLTLPTSIERLATSLSPPIALTVFAYQFAVNNNPLAFEASVEKPSTTP